MASKLWIADTCSDVILTFHSLGDYWLKETLDKLLWGYPKLVDAAMNVKARISKIEERRAHASVVSISEGFSRPPDVPVVPLPPLPQLELQNLNLDSGLPEVGQRDQDIPYNRRSILSISRKLFGFASNSTNIDGGDLTTHSSEGN